MHNEFYISKHASYYIYTKTNLYSNNEHHLSTISCNTRTINKQYNNKDSFVRSTEKTRKMNIVQTCTCKNNGIK